MIRNVLTLTRNDLATTFKNKTLYLILFIPVFIFVALEFVDGDDLNMHKLNIGLIAKEDYPAALVHGLESADRVFTVSRFPDEGKGRQWLKERKGDGILVPAGKKTGGVALIVLGKNSSQTVAIVESLSKLQRALEGKRKDWISEIRPLQDKGIQTQMLPTWILMVVLLVGFIVLPAQVAEEKEKKLLLGLLQTPIREVEWLLAKVCLGIILIVIAMIFLHLLARPDMKPGGDLSYFAFMMAGGFCFSAFGIFVGFLCRTQASARTVGILFYLPQLLPSALSDFSQKFYSVAPFFPSYQFYAPVKAILLEGAGLSDFPLEWTSLFGIGLAAFFLSYRLMKRRWLM